MPGGSRHQFSTGPCLPLLIFRHRLQAALPLVSEELEPWDRLQSAPFKKFAQSIHPQAWVPEVKTVQQHARAKVRSSACLHVF